MEKHQILECVLFHVSSIFPVLEKVEVTPHKFFIDLGANSIDRALLVDCVLNTLSLDIPLIDLLQSQNIAELVDSIYERQYSVGAEFDF